MNKINDELLDTCQGIYERGYEVGKAEWKARALKAEEAMTFLTNQRDMWQTRALKAEAECAELGESMRRIGIEQFEANAARLKAEQALREIDKVGYSKRGGQAGAMQRIARAYFSEKGE